MGAAHDLTSPPSTGRGLLGVGFRVVVALVAAALLVVYGAGWHYASQILTPVEPDDGPYPVTIEAVGNVNVRLERRPDTERPGVWGLDQPDGYAQVREITSSDQQSVSRRLRPFTGTVEAGDQARIDTAAYPPDPADAFFFPVHDVSLDGELGPLPADLVWPAGAVGDPEGREVPRRRPAPRDTWVVLVHGRGAHRAETYRLLPTLRDLGLPAVSVSYRNDADAPASPDGQYGLGSTEWRDVAAATDWAFANGARDVVLVGYSMGGAIVATYLHESDDAERVRGVILDAPVLDWGPPLRAAARDRGVPAGLTPVAQALVTIRTGIRWGDLDQVERAGEFETPMLIFHGTDDEVVPAATSAALAEAREDLVTYVPVDDAGHVQSWNVDPDAYTRQVREFLLDVLD